MGDFIDRLFKFHRRLIFSDYWTSKMRKSAAVLFSLSAVSACGGGGGSVVQSLSIDTIPIRVFADDSGVARYTATSNGEIVTGYLSSPDLALVLEELEATGEVLPFDRDSLAISGTGPNTTLRSGAINVDGQVVNISAAITTDEDAALFLFEDPLSGSTLLLTSGEQVTNIPTGSATYSGVFGFQDLVYDAEPETGTFTATTSFSGTPNIVLSGATDSYDVNGTALISGGRFASSSMLIEGAGFSVAGRMNGDFHGKGANSVAGVIYSNDDYGDFRGAFVGSQD